MIAGVSIENRGDGLRVVLTSAWSDSIGHYLQNKNVMEIELNHAKGWHGKKVAFLSAFPRLQCLKILDLTIPSVEPIHDLHELRSLDVITYCKTQLRFSAFPHLEDCALEWRPKTESLFDCRTLKKLFVNRYKGKDMEPFGRLKLLESLAVLNAPIENLRGLSGLKGLCSLRLANLRSLASLAGIETLTSLQELKIQTCRKITSIAEVERLSQLKKFIFDNGDGITSLKPLSKLAGLELVAFCESTNVLDGDLSPLVALKNLKVVTYQNRRHYSHRREEFPPRNDANLTRQP